jgi:hypothetical protein
MKAKFDKPTGELKGDNAKSVGSALEEKTKKGGAFGALSAVRGALAVAEGNLQDEPISCPQTTNYSGGKVTCTCNGGGTVTVSVDASAIGSDGQGPFSMTYSYNSCKITQDDATQTINGSGSYVRASASAQDMYFSFHGTVETSGETQTIDVEYYSDASGKIWWLVTVDNGTYVVNGTYDSTTGSGEWSVRDNTGKVFNCIATEGKGACTAEDGTTMEF